MNKSTTLGLATAVTSVAAILIAIAKLEKRYSKIHFAVPVVGREDAVRIINSVMDFVKNAKIGSRIQFYGKISSHYDETKKQVVFRGSMPCELVYGLSLAASGLCK